MILDLGYDCWNLSILGKTYRNVDLDKIAENVDYSQNFRKMGQNLQISRFWSNFSKHLNFHKKFRK